MGGGRLCGVVASLKANLRQYKQLGSERVQARNPVLADKDKDTNKDTGHSLGA